MLNSSGTEDEDRMPQFKEEDFEVRKLISNGAYGMIFLYTCRCRMAAFKYIPYYFSLFLPVSLSIFLSVSLYLALLFSLSLYLPPCNNLLLQERYISYVIRSHVSCLP